MTGRLDDHQTATPKQGVRRLGSVDGVRAIATGFVFAYHGSVLLGAGGFMSRHWNVVGLFGPLGVCIFFVISGFLLFRPFVGAILGDRAFPAAGVFWLRRALRILPAYWVALTLLWLVFDRIQIGSVGEFFTFYGLAQNYRTGFVDSGLDVAWTLVIEMSFYLVLPIFAVALVALARRARQLRTRYLVALAGAASWFVGGMAVRVWDIWFRAGPQSARGTWFAVSQTTRWLPGYLHWFAGGMMLAVVVEWVARGGEMPRVLRLLGDYPWVSWLVAAGFLGVDIAIDLPQNVYLGTPMQGLVVTLCTPLFATFLFLPTVIGDTPSVIRAALASVPMAWIGLVSYGVYLWHRPIMVDIIERTSGAGARTGFAWVGVRYAIAIATTLAVAAASYYLVERPCIRVSHRFRRRRSHDSQLLAVSEAHS